MKPLVCPLARQARLNGKRPAVIESGVTLTYEQLDYLVNHAQTVLRKRGISRGERIALFAANSAEEIIVLYALWRMGAISCPLNTYQSAAIIKKQLRVLNSKFMITDRKSLSISGVRLMFLADIFNSLTYTSMVRVKDFTFRETQPMTILFTSGTTASPKAALHSFGNYYYNALGSNRRINLSPDDRWLLSLPLYHVGGLCIIFRCLLAGATIVIPKNREEALHSLSRDKITHVSLVPTQLQRLLQSKNLKNSKSLKCLLLGGAPVPRELLKRALKKKLPVHLTYGLTEMTSQVATSPRLRNVKSIGAKILPYAHVKIAGDGEILVKGKTLFQGYIQGKRSNGCVIDDGWFQTRDLGSVDANKTLIVSGRKDNQFISGGENIQPEEIEKHLLELPGIGAACVIPKRDALYGFRPIALIDFERGRKVSRKKIEIFLEKRIATYKIPDAFYRWPSIEESRTRLKVPRQRLQDYFRKNRRKLSKIN